MFFFQCFLRSECLGFRLLFLRLFMPCHTRLHSISSLYNAENHLPCFLLFLQTVLCHALDFTSRRGRCGGQEPALKNAYEKARQFDTKSVGCVFINVFLPGFSTVSRFPLTFSTLVYAVSYSPSLYFKSFLCRKSCFVFLIFLRTVFRNALDFTSRRGRV